MDGQCEIRKQNLPEPSVKHTEEEIKKLDAAIEKCGEDCDCCFFAGYGGLGAE